MCSATSDSERMSRNHSCPCETNYGAWIDPEVLTHYTFTNGSAALVFTSLEPCTTAVESLTDFPSILTFPSISLGYGLRFADSRQSRPARNRN